jgi:hypothetical protein
MNKPHPTHDLLRPLRSARSRVRRFAYRSTMGPSGPVERSDNTVPVPHHR